MKLCAPCLKSIERAEGAVCLSCRRALKALLLGGAQAEAKWPAFWVPDADATLVAGMSGMGKSTFEKAWTAHLMEQGVPVFWWDAMREGSREGIERARAPLGPLLHQRTVSQLEQNNWIEWAGAEGLAMVPNEERPSRKQRAEDFVRAMSLFIQDKPKEMECVLLITEAGLLEGETAAEEMLVEIASTWRKEGVAVGIDSQATSMVPDLARRQCKTLVAFKQVDVNDRNALARLATTRFAKAVAKLPPHSCLVADRMDLSEWEEQGPEEAGAEEAA